MAYNKVARLLKKAQKGDDQAFAKIIRSKSARINYIAFSMLKNQHDAKDAVQDSVLAMYRHLGDLSSAHAFDSWMYQVVFRTCLRHQERSKKQQGVPLDEVMDFEMTESRTAFIPHEWGEERENAEELAGLIRELPDNHRNALYLFYYEGLSYNEIADAMDASIQDVSNWLNRARKKLRLMLEEGEGRGAKDVSALVMSALALDMERIVPHDASTTVEEALTEIFSVKSSDSQPWYSAINLEHIAATSLAVLLVCCGVLGWLLWSAGDESGASDIPASQVAEAPAAGGAPRTNASDTRSGASSSGSQEVRQNAGSSINVEIVNTFTYEITGSQQPSDLNASDDPHVQASSVAVTLVNDQDASSSGLKGTGLSKTGDGVFWLVAMLAGTLLIALSTLATAAKKRQ